MGVCVLLACLTLIHVSGLVSLPQKHIAVDSHTYFAQQFVMFCQVGHYGQKARP